MGEAEEAGETEAQFFRRIQGERSRAGAELVALEVRDLETLSEGITATVRRSKTNQEGRGRLIAVPRGRSDEMCPIRTPTAWLEAAKLTEGSIFREVTRHGHVGGRALAGRSVARVIRRAASAVGLADQDFSGHSLRAGFVTQAKLMRKDEASIMRQTGHCSLAMMRKYDRHREIWANNAAEGLLD